jgi:lycopene beta-cyclase
LTKSIVILGGGCAGLALARALSIINYRGQVTILDSRYDYTNDKTWCFWAKPNNSWSLLAPYYWQKCLFSTNDHNPVVQKYTKYQYCCLPSNIYYQHCLNLIQKPNIKLLTNVEVQAIQLGKDSQSFPSYIETSQGLTSADIVVDTRSESIENALLYQSFLGQEIQLTEPICSHDTVRLMCNMKANNQGISFYYLLPLTEDRVLVEPTIFSRQVLPPLQLQPLFQEIYNIENIEVKKVLRQESAVLPMGREYKSPKAGVIKGGIAGGALRSSSGYGFLRIQHWAEQCAYSILNDQNATYYSQDPFQEKMDRLFLQVIRNNPKLGLYNFMQLSTHLSPDIFASFMSDSSTYYQWVQVIRALPKWPFIKELINGKKPIYNQ